MSPLITEATYVGAVLLASTFMLSLAAWLWSDAESLQAKLIASWAGLHVALGPLVVAHVLAPNLEVVRYAYDVGISISSAIPVVVFLFTIVYTGRDRWLSRRALGVVGGWYLLLVAMVLTDPLFGLAYAEYATFTTPFTYVYGMPTTAFSIVSLPLWLLVIAAPALLGASTLSESGITRAQSLSLFVGFLVPFVVLFLWLGEIIPGPANGAFVISATITGSLIWWAVYRYHLFDLVPLSRETVFDELNDAVLVVDRDLRLLDLNRVAVETFPDLEDEIGTGVDQLLPALTDASEPDSRDPFPSTFTSYDGDEPRGYDVTVSRLPSESTFHGYGLIVHDVTDQRRRIRDLEQQTTQLERFASTLSHDIRNPLNVAQGNVELAMEDDPSESLERADEAVDRIEQIVDDLLTLSREGRTIDDRQFVDLGRLAEAAWKTTATEDATLDVDLDPGAGVYADETRLRNVFENLFRNALTFAGPDVTVRVGRHPDGFFVEDDGPGIPQDEREQVFEYEFTTDSSGTGIGLAVVDSIARAHGWSVDVMDGSEGGARFVFSGADVVRAPSSTRPGETSNAR